MSSQEPVLSANGGEHQSDPEQGTRDHQAYGLAMEYLTVVCNVPRERIEKYVNPAVERPNSLNGIYERLLQSAQSGGMSPSVIGGSIGGVNNLGKVLFD